MRSVIRRIRSTTGEATTDRSGSSSTAPDGGRKRRRRGEPAQRAIGPACVNCLDEGMGDWCSAARDGKVPCQRCLDRPGSWRLHKCELMEETPWERNSRYETYVVHDRENRRVQPADRSDAIDNDDKPLARRSGQRIQPSNTSDDADSDDEHLTLQRRHRKQPLLSESGDDTIVVDVPPTRVRKRRKRQPVGDDEDNEDAVAVGCGPPPRKKRNLRVHIPGSNEEADDTIIDVDNAFAQQSPPRRVPHASNSLGGLIGRVLRPLHDANIENLGSGSSLQRTRNPFEDGAEDSIPRHHRAAEMNNQTASTANRRRADAEEELLNHHQALQSRNINQYDSGSDSDYDEIVLPPREQPVEAVNVTNPPRPNPPFHWHIQHLPLPEMVSRNQPADPEGCWELKPAWGPDGKPWCPPRFRLHPPRPPPHIPMRRNCRHAPAKICDHLLDDDIFSCRFCHIDQTRDTMQRRLVIIEETKSRFCQDCVNSVRASARFLVNRCYCITQLITSWVCNSHYDGILTDMLQRATAQTQAIIERGDGWLWPSAELWRGGDLCQSCMRNNQPPTSDVWRCKLCRHTVLSTRGNA